MIKVYIASKYTGDEIRGANMQMSVADRLIENGFAPFMPLLYHFLDKEYPQSYDTWMSLGGEWLEQCDCVLRLPGASSGADMEVELANQLEIPVFYTIESLIKAYK